MFPLQSGHKMTPNTQSMCVNILDKPAKIFLSSGRDEE